MLAVAYRLIALGTEIFGDDLGLSLKVEYEATLFLTVGFADALQQFDIDLLRELNGAGSNDILDSLMVLFTIAGLSFVIVFFSIPLWMRGKCELAFDVVVSVILATVLAEAIKIIVDRPRPIDELDNVRTIISASGPSFPSAHAVRAFAVATLVSFGGLRSVVVSAFSFASLIALSRVYLGVHWPSDVVAGAILGVGVAILMRWLERHSNDYRSLRAYFVDYILRFRSSRHEATRTSGRNLS